MNGRAILLAGAAVLLLPLAPASLALAVSPQQATPFAPPSESFILSRTVVRELSDGNSIKVTRRYSVQFAPDALGYRLDGKLIDVTVDVPAELNSLAQIERQRKEAGMFPVRLDSMGTIVPDQTEETIDHGSHDQMALRAQNLLAGSGMTGGNLQAGNQVISKVLQPRQVSSWPTDLFRVPPGEHRQSRIVALPGGIEGKIEVVTKVDSLLPCGLPQTIERTVVTLISGNKRVSHEIWTFQMGSG